MKILCRALHSLNTLSKMQSIGTCTYLTFFADRLPVSIMGYFTLSLDVIKPNQRSALRFLPNIDGQARRSMFSTDRKVYRSGQIQMS